MAAWAALCSDWARCFDSVVIRLKASLTFKCMAEHLFADFSYSMTTGYLFMKTNNANE